MFAYSDKYSDTAIFLMVIQNYFLLIQLFYTKIESVSFHEKHFFPFKNIIMIHTSSALYLINFKEELYIIVQSTISFIFQINL